MMRESWLPAAPESAGTARGIVREAAMERGFDDTATWDLMLATTEAVANAVLHGRACSAERPIRLRIGFCDEGMCVEVCDCGKFDGQAPPKPNHGPSGRGMPIISALSDTFEVVPMRCSTRVRFGKRRVAVAA